MAITEQAIIETILNQDEAIAVYVESPPGNYTVQPLDPTLSLITLKIDPCKYDAFNCCEKVNEGKCQDNLIVAKGNLVLAWAYNNIVIICNGDFEEYKECGVFLEIHKPREYDILSEIRVTQLFSTGFHMENMYTKSLEPGNYEVWWVERGRNGNFLQCVKPFFVI